jgi:hypothetical protein
MKRRSVLGDQIGGRCRAVLTPAVGHLNDPGAEDPTWEIMLRLAEYSNGDRSLPETKALLRDDAQVPASAGQPA